MVLTVQKTQLQETGIQSLILQMHFSQYLPQKSQVWFAFTWKGSQFTVTVLPQSYLNSPAYCYDLVRRNLYLMQVLSVIILYIDDIIIETEEKTRTELNAVMTHMTNRGWQINPANTQEPKQTVKFLGLTWAGATCHLPQATESKFLSLSTPGTKQESQCLV